MKPYRIEKVSSEVRSIVSDAIKHRLQDPRISPLTSVTRVEVSGDLALAHIHVSVYGSQSEQSKTMRALEDAAGYIQQLLAKALPIRQCPHLVFHHDESLKKGDEVLRMIDANERQRDLDAAKNLPGQPEASRPAEGNSP